MPRKPANAKSKPVNGRQSQVILRDVAKIAGVSTATVSRAMNDPEVVSPELRQRIASVIDHLGWVPHGAARALATRRAGAVGAIFPTLSHGDFARAIEALQSQLAPLGYTLLLACSEYNPEQEYSQVRKFVERGVDAVLLVGEAHHPELIKFLTQRNVPYLNVFVYNADSHGTCVGPDNCEALFDLTNYLIDLGHKRFGVIAQSTENNDRALARLQGIRKALAEHSLAIHPHHFADGHWTIGEGRKLFRQIFSQQPTPTAILCGNPYLTVGAMLESQAMGIRVPADLSIAGYDDIEIMSELPIPITTVRVQGDEVGRRAALQIVARIEGKTPDPDFKIRAEIVVRASSGPAPRNKRNK
jgi:LacI family transcriptional regulator